MQILLTRQEIRAQMRALLGQTTTEAIAAQTLNQYNAFIDAAALKTFGDCAWLSAQVRSTVDLTTAQYKLAYPTDAAVGSLLEIAVYDTGSQTYRPLQSKNLPAWLDFDQLEAAGGTDYSAIQGEPQYWQQRGDYVYLYPPNDTTARKLRLRYTRSKKFTDEVTQSLVDGQAIIYWATALAYGAMADQEQRQFFQGLYTDRISQLRGWQNTGERVPIDQTASFDDSEDQFRPVPNWSRAPRV